ncbi:hypothetical protein Tco_0539250, partial [Tanacetum coccineum]
ASEHYWEQQRAQNLVHGVDLGQPEVGRLWYFCY